MKNEITENFVTNKGSELFYLLQKGFDCSLVGLSLIHIENGTASARIIIKDELLNFAGTLHGGAIATLVDDIGSLAILSRDPYQRLGVTIDLNVSYFIPAKKNDSIYIEAKTLSCGLNLAVVEVSLFQEKNHKLIAKGLMTSSLGRKRNTAAFHIQGT